MIARLPLIHGGNFDPDIVTIWFSWSGSLIATMSTIVPMQLVFHHFVNGSWAHISLTRRLQLCLTVVVVYATAMVISASVLAANIITSARLLLIYRCYFFVNVTVECTVMIACIRIINQTTVSLLQRKPSSTTLARTALVGGKMLTDAEVRRMNAAANDAKAAVKTSSSSNHLYVCIYQFLAQFCFFFFAAP